MRKVILFLVVPLIMSCSSEVFEEENGSNKVSPHLSIIEQDTVVAYKVAVLYQYYLENDSVFYVNPPSFEEPTAEKEQSSPTVTQPLNWYANWTIANTYIQFEDEYAIIRECGDRGDGVGFKYKYYVDYSFDKETGLFVLGSPFYFPGVRNEADPSADMRAQYIELEAFKQYGSNVIVLDIDRPCSAWSPIAATHSRIILLAVKCIFDDKIGVETDDFRKGKFNGTVFE